MAPLDARCTAVLVTLEAHRCCPRSPCNLALKRTLMHRHSSAESAADVPLPTLCLPTMPCPRHSLFLPTRVVPVWCLLIPCRVLWSMRASDAPHVAPVSSIAHRVPIPTRATAWRSRLRAQLPCSVMDLGQGDRVPRVRCRHDCISAQVHVAAQAHVH